MEQREDTYYRSFFLSFSTAFFLLSVLFLFLVTTVHPKTPASLELEPLPQEVVAYLPRTEDALTVLFIGTEAGSAEAGSYLLARFDPVRGQVPIAVFPAQTLVQGGNGVEPLAAVYRYGGADYARAALERTLGVEIHRYVRISDSAFVAAAGVIGAVEFELSADLPLDQGGIQTVLHQGVQLLDGQKALAILAYGGYEGGEQERCRIMGQFAASLVNQRIDVVESTLADKVFETVINLIDTDISHPDYHERKEAAVFLAQLRQEPAAALEVTGRMDEAGERFTVDDTCLARLLQYFA